MTPPPDSDLDDEQILALLASPLYTQEREASAERSQVYHSERENLMSSSSQDPTCTEEPVAVVNQDTFSDRDEFSFRHQQVFIRFSNPTNVAKSLSLSLSLNTKFGSAIGIGGRYQRHP